MAKKTQQEILVDMLERKGWVESMGSSRKYVVLKLPSPMEGNKFYVGRNGALRFGPTIARSYPHGAKHALLMAYKLEEANG